jgi:hypothetical protein
VMEVVAREVVG